MDVETAHLFSPCEFKLAGREAGQAMTFTGYAAVFGNVDAYGDVIERGAFAAWLRDVDARKQSRPAMLSQHGGFGMSADDMTPVGTWTHLEEDDVGLKVSGRFAETERGRELHALMKMEPPAISGLSIGYLAREFETGARPNEPRRRLKRIDVLEISPVTFPANSRARITAVKAGTFERPTDIRSLERALRSAFGFTALEAKRIASGGWPAFIRDDADDEASLQEISQILRRTTALLT